MQEREREWRRTLEVCLVLVAVGLTCVLYQITGLKLIVLNLYFLPVVLAAIFLGRYRAGVLALLSVILASVAIAADLGDAVSRTSPVMVLLSVTAWGAILGLTTLLVGTLSDERSAKIVELHEAYVGVVEVLSRYLQSANPRLKDRSKRVAELSHRVAVQLRLSEKEIDDLRVAALLHGMEHLEITAKVIRKAVGDLGSEGPTQGEHTFHGTDLVHSLGSVLSGAFPLLLNQTDEHDLVATLEGLSHPAETPMGAKIIRTVRAYDQLMTGRDADKIGDRRRAIQQLRADIDAAHHPAVLHALEQVVADDPRPARPAAAEPLELAAAGI